MDFDSWMMLIALIGLALMPAWVMWLSRRIGTGRVKRVLALLAASVASLAVVHVAPFGAMVIRQGTLKDNLDDPMFPVGLAILFGPQFVGAVALSLWLGITGDPENRSRRSL